MISIKKNKLISLTYCLIMSFFVSSVMAGETTLVGVNNKGIQGNGIDLDRETSISSDGRYITFASNSSNLVAGDKNNQIDIFVRDLLLKKTTIVSVASSGEQANGASHLSSISADGRFVAFESLANNLVEGDSNGSSDVYVYDRQNKTTTLISVDSNGGIGNDQSGNPSISADGRYIAFESYASNLINGDDNFSLDVFIHDRLTKKTTSIIFDATGTQGNNFSGNPSISADGRYVSFESLASNLVADDTNNNIDVFVYDQKTIGLTRVSVNSNGMQGNGNSNWSSISADGRIVAFESFASNLVDGDTNGFLDVFVRDRVTKQTARVSVDSNKSVNGNAHSERPVLSADGRYVAFVSCADNLVSVDKNPCWDDFLHDRLSKKTSLISLTNEGDSANGVIYLPSINSDGRFVAFRSLANNLVSGDVNNANDVFVRDRLLDTVHHADLNVSVKQKPGILTANNFGLYNFNITNNGPDTITNVQVTHTLSNGPQLISIIPSQGLCKQYATISLCQLGKLLPGTSSSIVIVAKAVDDPFIQNVFVRGQPMDNVPTNNRVSISTKVNP